MERVEESEPSTTRYILHQHCTVSKKTISMWCSVLLQAREYNCLLFLSVILDRVCSQSVHPPTILTVANLKHCISTSNVHFYVSAFSICRVFGHVKTTYFLICNLYQVVVIKLIFCGMFQYQKIQALQCGILCSTTKIMFSQYPWHMSNSWHASSLHFPFINGESVRRTKPTYHSHWTHQETML